MSNILVLASSNPGKIIEFQRILPADIEIRLAGDLGIILPPETGRTFKENAVSKATAAAAASGHVAIGDDSGLEVDALNGLPGVRSARYAGEEANNDDNVAKLLASMSEVPADQRTARFRCVIAMAEPCGTVHAFEGEATGAIGNQPKGTGGFGYDPVFIIEDGRTFGELSPEEKDLLSHRGIAMRALGPELQRFLDSHCRYTGTR